MKTLKIFLWRCYVQYKRYLYQIEQSFIKLIYWRYLAIAELKIIHIKRSSILSIWHCLIKLAIHFSPSPVQINLLIICPLTEKYWHWCDSPTFNITEFLELNHIWKKTKKVECIMNLSSCHQLSQLVEVPAERLTTEKKIK